MVTKKELTCYETDASRLVGKADNVVFPKTIEEVENLIKTSDKDVVPRGGGSEIVGGCIPNNSLIINTTKMNKILDFNKEKRNVYVEAGISVKELNEKLESIGFEFPISVLNGDISTIGGMIAMNSLDSRFKYGEMREWIEELEFINGRGELMKTSKADLMDICGMEGITGIIVRVKLKIIPKIKRSFSIFQTDEIEEIFSIARRLKLERNIIGLDFFSKSFSKLLDLPEKYHILIEFDSDRGKIKGEEYEELISKKNNLYFNLLRKGYYNNENVKFFFDKLKDFILYLESNEIPYFSYLGHGIVYGFFKDEEENKRKKCVEMMKKMRGKIGDYGITRKNFIDDFEVKILQRVKKRHDPFWKLNKGKIIRAESGDSLAKKEIPLAPEKMEFRRKVEKQIPERKLEIKAPEKRMNEFIKRVEDEEKFYEQEEEEKEVTEKIKDYEQTYDSELGKRRVEEIEEIAKKVPQEIVKENIKLPESTMKDDFDRPSENIENNFNAQPRGQVSKSEQDLINSVLGNKLGSGKKEEKKDDNRSR
jgi:FAD/FMN-containing dehydrogenase